MTAASGHGSPARSRLEILSAAALFSTGGAAIKACSLSGSQLASFRSGIAALAVLAMLPAARRIPSPRAVAVGAAYAATMILFVRSNKLTTAANSIFLQSTAPLYVLLLAPWLLREKLRPRDLGFMAAIAAGLAMFFVGNQTPSASAPDPVRGNLLAALAGASWALTVIGLRGMARHGGATEAPVAGAVLSGNIIAFAVSLPGALPLTRAGMGASDWLVVVYLGVFQIGLAYVLLTFGMRHIGALEASLLLLLEPVLNPIWAWIAQGEKPGAWALAGGAVILLSTAAKTWLDRS